MASVKDVTKVVDRMAAARKAKATRERNAQAAQLRSAASRAEEKAKDVKNHYYFLRELRWLPESFAELFERYPDGVLGRRAQAVFSQYRELRSALRGVAERTKRGAQDLTRAADALPDDLGDLLFGLPVSQVMAPLHQLRWNVDTAALVREFDVLERRKNDLAQLSLAAGFIVFDLHTPEFRREWQFTQRLTVELAGPPGMGGWVNIDGERAAGSESRLMTDVELWGLVGNLLVDARIADDTPDDRVVYMG